MTAPHPPIADLPRRRARFWLLLVGFALAALVAGVGYWAVGMRPPHDGKPGERPGTNRQVPDGPGWFQDMTDASGLRFTHRNGEEADQFTLLETLGGGVALLDYDGDGRLDIFVTGGGFFDGPDKKTLKGLPCKLYRNLGNWKFEDVTARVGLDVPWFYNHGVAVADYDRDGWPDLLVTGYGHLTLFRNESDGKGGRRFVDVSKQVGIGGNSWYSSAAWGDLDGDGWPDLYVCCYVDWSPANNPVCRGPTNKLKRDTCPPLQFKPLTHVLWRNEKGQRFRDVSAAHKFKPEGSGLGVLLVDVNDDGTPDIFVSNDGNRNFLFVNRRGKLDEIGIDAGVATDENGQFNGSMGVDAADYDGTGRASLWVTNFQGELHALYRNLGRESFLHQSRASGIATIGQDLVGFGTAFVDIDRDGWEDLVIANGHVLRYPKRGSTLKQRPILLRNVEYRGRRFFEDASAWGGPFFESAAVGRGLAVGDLDNDGLPDLVISHTNSPVTLLRNQAPPAGWLGVKLVGRDHRDVVGSTVIVESDGRRLTRFTKGGGSYLSASDRRILFGLGQGAGERKVRVTVKWSWGKEQIWENLASGCYWELREGEPAPKRLDGPAYAPATP